MRLACATEWERIPARFPIIFQIAFIHVPIDFRSLATLFRFVSDWILASVYIYVFFSNYYT